MFDFVRKRSNTENSDNADFTIPSHNLRLLNVSENIVQQGSSWPSHYARGSIDSDHSLVENCDVPPSYEEVVADNYYNPSHNASVFHAECYDVHGSHIRSAGVGSTSKLVEYGFQRSKIYVRD